MDATPGRTKIKGTATLTSMTGFASGRGTHAGWSWTVELRSVNGRGLDLRLRLPDWIEGLEPALRKLLQSRLARGNVTLNIRLQREEGSATARLSTENLNTAMHLLREIETAAKDTGLRLRKTSASDIAAMRGVIDTSDTAEEEVDALKSALLDSATVALADFEADRAREGAAIATLISNQIDRLEGMIAAAASIAGDRDVAARAAMDRALRRLLDATEVPDEARLLQELALISVKTDVTEELDRLGAHINEARALLAQPDAVGRKFDFLMQEFNREANTLCSKSQSTALTAIGLDLKALIDQMREQVQNIE
jgi:uncharacterized protein (TIGR00255 family)